MWRKHIECMWCRPWAAWYNAWLLIKLTLKGVVFSSFFCCRCQESTNHVAIRMHVVEGQYSTVQAFVVPQTCPRLCKAAVHVIKPLCMHHRLNAWEGSVPMNELQITGDALTSNLRWMLVAYRQIRCSIKCPGCLPAHPQGGLMRLHHPESDRASDVHMLYAVCLTHDSCMQMAVI